MAEKLVKICFVVPRTYYLFDHSIKNISDKVGGAQKQAYLLSTALATMGNFDVHFIVADFGQEKINQIENVTIWKSFNFTHNIFVRSFHFLKCLLKVNADIYLFRSADMGGGIALLFIKYLMRKKTIYMIASNTETSYIGNKKVFGCLTAHIMQIIYKKTDKLTAQTKEQGELFQKKKKRNPDVIIRNVIEIKEQTLQKEITKDIILWVGRLDKLKQPEIFLNLAHRHRDEKFVMIAPVVLEHYEYGKYMQNQIKNEDNIEYIEFVKPYEIISYYKRAKIYVTTSVEEGYSNTMMEAMAEKCAILSLKVNPENIINKYRLGYCGNGNLQRFFSLFEKIIADKHGQIKMGENSYHYLKKNHNTKKETEKLANLLIELSQNV